MLRILHTADWHLGQTLHGISREYEHRCFLDWLLEVIQERTADSLLVSGDVFDSTNPPASALASFYRFLAEARCRRPDLDMVIVAGNHDSPARLEAPGPLYRSVGAHVVGSLSRATRGQVDWRPLSVPLRDRDGRIAARCAAVPFLRPADLPRIEDDEDPLLEGFRQVYSQVLSGIRQEKNPWEAIVATGHCYMVGTRLSEFSERKIMGGNQHAIPVDVFPSDVSYAALGHLHLAQMVDGQERIRYCGSPLPLALDENDYDHQVLLISLEGGRLMDIESIPVPQRVEILRLPPGGPLPPDQVLPLLERLNVSQRVSEEQPFLEVRVYLQEPEPDLRRRVEEMLRDKPVRLLRISASYPRGAGSLADGATRLQLQELTPEEVFLRRYRQFSDDSPPQELMSAFYEIVESVQSEIPS